MNSDTREEILPANFIKGIEKSIDDVKSVRKNKIKVKRSDIDWSKIKENVEDLKIKCADFSRKIEGTDINYQQDDLAEQAKEIRVQWIKIRSIMDGEK